MAAVLSEADELGKLNRAAIATSRRTYRAIALEQLCRNEDSHQSGRDHRHCSFPWVSPQVVERFGEARRLVAMGMASAGPLRPGRACQAGGRSHRIISSPVRWTKPQRVGPHARVAPRIHPFSSSEE
jgi:hypothetical protein